jgi:hypothetical protein
MAAMKNNCIKRMPRNRAKLYNEVLCDVEGEWVARECSESGNDVRKRARVGKLSFMREFSHNEMYSHNKMIGYKIKMPFLV